jgi:hypothetical protein
MVYLGYFNNLKINIFALTYNKINKIYILYFM